MIQKYFILMFLMLSLCSCESSFHKGMPTGSRSVTTGAHRTIEVPVETTASATHSNRNGEGKTSNYNKGFVPSTSNIFDAAKDNNIDDIHYFYQSGVNINAGQRGFLGLKRTALHYAARDNNVEAVELLLELDADVHVRDGQGNTALHLAADSNSVEVADVLLNTEIGIDVKNNREETALLVAARRGRFEVIKVLVQYGPDLGVTNRDGRTARQVASRLFYRRIAHLLREHEEKIEEQVSEAMERVKQNEIAENRAKKIRALAPL